MTKSNETYNGWANWDTWNAYNWISSYEYSYLKAIHDPSPQSLIKILSDTLKHHNVENNDSIDFEKVFWTELTEAFSEE